MIAENERIFNEEMLKEERKMEGKERANLYEEVEFANNYAYAMQVKAESEEKLQKVKKVWVISIVGSICGAFAFTNVICMMISFIVACICYFQVGGIKIAINWSWKLAKFGWLVCPYFPVDLVVGLFAFFIGIYGLFFMPFFTVNHTRKQALMDLEAADSFLYSCQQVQSEYNF